jgi:hypothetical protein
MMSVNSLEPKPRLHDLRKLPFLPELDSSQMATRTATSSQQNSTDMADISYIGSICATSAERYVVFVLILPHRQPDSDIRSRRMVPQPMMTAARWGRAACCIALLVRITQRAGEVGLLEHQDGCQQERLCSDTAHVREAT